MTQYDFLPMPCRSVDVIYFYVIHLELIYIEYFSVTVFLSGGQGVWHEFSQSNNSYKERNQKVSVINSAWKHSIQV